MKFAQSTLEEIIDSERLMLLTAKQRYGQFYNHARECTVFLSRCITEVDLSHSMMFGRLFSHTKKSHMLALLSALRLHKVQAMMNLRQVLEAGAAAAFAIAHPEQRHFAEINNYGLLDPTQKLTKKRYAWLAENFPEKSDWIAETKDRINQSTAHANIVSADQVFRVNDASDRIDAPFFDVEDEYHVKCDLWLISSVAITLMDFFYGVNLGNQSIGFCPGFLETVGRVGHENNVLRLEMKATDRFRTAAKKYGLAGEGE